jgi:hypothetical protein
LEQPLIAHSLLAAHADRVQDLVRLYSLLESAAAATDAGGDAARSAHRSLGARIVEWEAADLHAERREVVTLAPDEREAMRADVARAIVHAQRYAADSPADEDDQAVVRSLQQIHAAFPATLTRAALVRFRRSAARMVRIEALDGPTFVLGSEASVLLSALESASAPIAPGEVQFDPAKGFRDTFAYALEACVIREPGAAGAADLGLGTSPAVAALLGVTAGDLDAIYDRWLDSAAQLHTFAPYPYVPRGRFCAAGAGGAVRDDLDATGSIGWAAGDDVAAVARDLAAAARANARFAPELQAAVQRVESAASDGHAVIGFIEYVPPQSEGWRKWFTAHD